MKKAVVVYWSKGGNTQKVALAIERGLAAGGCATSIRTVQDAEDIDLFDYDLVCFGVPSYNWHPPKPADEYLKAVFARYRSEGRVKVSAPTLPGKYALVFCTYSGPHTGIREAIPVGKYIGQYFEHLGYTVADEWYVLGEFHGSDENNLRGRMGDIRGLPSAEDLERIASRAQALVDRLLTARP